MAGDDEETTKFRSDETEEGDGVDVPVAPVLGVGVVEEDEDVAVLLLLLARPEEIHSVLSTATTFCCFTPNAKVSERKRGDLRGEAAAEREKEEGS